MATFPSFMDEWFTPRAAGPGAARGVPGDPGLTDQVRAWLRNQAQNRAAGMGAAPAPTPAAAPPVAAPPAIPAPTTGAYKAGRFLGKTVGRLGAIGGLGAMGFGMADQAAAIQADPESKPWGERALQVLSGADITGLGARAGRWLADRPEPITPVTLRGPVPTASQFANEPGSAPAVSMDPAMFASAPPAATGAVAALPPVTPMTAADIAGSRIPVSGTGAFVNNTTGVVTNLDTRAIAGPTGPMVDATTYDRMRGAAPRAADFGLPDRTPIPAMGGNAAGRFFGAGATLKTMANTQAANLARNKLAYDLAKSQATVGATVRGQDITAQTAAMKLENDRVLKGPDAEVAAAKAGIDFATLDMARAARRRGASEAEVAAILGRRAPEASTFQVPLTAMPDKSGALPVLQTRGPGAGGIRQVTPTQKVTSANIDAALAGSMKGKTRAQVIQAYRDRGYDVGDAN